MSQNKNSALGLFQKNCGTSGELNMFSNEEEEGKGRLYCGFDWSKLPEDLKVAILCLLPDKHLIRLKCVSKSWYFFISNSCAPRISSPFPTATYCGFFYTAKFLQTSKGLLYFTPDQEYVNDFFSKLILGLPTLEDLYSSYLPFEHKAEDLKDCCNGLFLLARASSNPTEYYVSYPTTYECIAIPINPHHVEDSQFASLAFDPIHSLNFKIVRIAKMLPLKLDVFSSELGCWASHIVPIECVPDGIKLIDRSIYLNGTLYLLSLTSYLVCIEFSEQANLILAHAIELPAKDEFNSSGSFGASRGCLFYSNCDNFKILVWQLKDGGHWILLHDINIDELVARPWAYTKLRVQRNLGLIKVYGFHPKSEDIYIGTPFLIQKYSPKTKELMRLDELPQSTRMIVDGQYKLFPYARCAVVLNGVIKNL